MRPPIPIQTPDTVSEVVLAACRTVVSNPNPVHVPVRLEAYSRPDDCHRNVAEKVRRDGGEVLFGWVVWEIPEWSIRLEFHSIYRTPQGRLLDVSPPLHEGQIVLFLHDPVRVYEGINIATAHYPYNNSEFCREHVAIFDWMNRLIFPPGKPYGYRHEVSEKDLELFRSRLGKLSICSRNP